MTMPCSLKHFSFLLDDLKKIRKVFLITEKDEIG
jgi:hypothetical protein